MDLDTLRETYPDVLFARDSAKHLIIIVLPSRIKDGVVDLPKALKFEAYAIIGFNEDGSYRRIKLLTPYSLETAVNLCLDAQ
jgi:hypothetical protein